MFSYLGYSSQNIVITDNNIKVYNNVLVEDQLMLDQVAITGVFNRKSKLESSVAITTMGAKEIGKVGFTVCKSSAKSGLI